ncbi:hypothetical protein PPL_06569 [Heterostelium album PN500]|uniref:PROP1-like PPR domain-containing protein n=1 Tax=Heterostelium pallidum (strain ATCC 26659 / Pp 5 / PN500) TaxID=670386 RepID=D3BDI6_HETP5|nr:hypothetical protein PPL_06569 [Heterostelium album PN500]EFA80531.1 hypothetical protein PPL_06569 [Heterostelium album PN500]|eukprot:XP_020432651.1 hypothetical protein PPL_06569 [Heterostelium album PN500]
MNSLLQLFSKSGSTSKQSTNLISTRYFINSCYSNNNSNSISYGINNCINNNNNNNRLYSFGHITTVRSSFCNSSSSSTVSTTTSSSSFSTKPELNNININSSNSRKDGSTLSSNKDYENDHNLMSIESLIQEDNGDISIANNKNNPFKSMDFVALYQHFNDTFIVNSKLDFQKLSEYLKLPNYQGYNVMNCAIQWALNNNCTMKEVYYAILVNFREANHFRDFQRCVKTMRHMRVNFDINIYNVLIGYYSDLSMQKDVQSLMSELDRLQKDPDNTVHYDTTTYYELIRCFNQKRKIVNELIEMMNRSGLVRPEHLTNLIIHILLNRHQAVSDALGYYEEIVKTHGTASAATFHSLLTGLAHLGRFDLVRHYWSREMKLADVTPSEDTVISIIKSYCDHKDIGNAIEFYFLIKKQFVPTLATYTPLIYMTIDSQKVEQCAEWLRIMKHNGIQLNERLASFVLRFYLRVGAFELLESLIRDVVNLNILTASSFSTILAYYHLTGPSKQHQINFFQKKLNEQEPRFIELATDQIIEVFLMMDEYENALEWLKKRISQSDSRRFAHTIMLFINYHKIRSEQGEVVYWENKLQENGLVVSKDMRLRTYYHMKKYYTPNSNPFNKPNLDMKRRILTQQLLWESLSPSEAGTSIAHPEKQDLFQQKLPEKTTEMDDDISLEDVKPKPTSTFKDIVQESPFSFRMRIMTLIKNKMHLQANREFKVKEESGFNIDGITYKMMVRAFITARDYSNAGSYFIKMIELGHEPVISLVYDLMDLYYSRGAKEYDEFSKVITSMSCKPSSFEEVHYSIMIKHNLTKTIKELMTVDNPKLTESISIRNSLVYGLTHRGDLELAQQVILGLINTNAKLSFTSISFLLRCYLEREEVPSILPQLVDYYKGSTEQMPINLANLVMLDYLKKGQISQALSELEKITNLNRYTNNYTIPIAMKLYAIKYPVPPMNNLFMWLNIKKLMLKNKISTLTFYPSLFKSLIEANQQEVVLRYASEPNFFVSQTVDTLKMVLSCCTSDKQIIDFFKSATKSKLQLDQEAFDIVKKANETIHDSRVDSYQLKNPKLQNQPPPLSQNIVNFIVNNLIKLP